MYCEFKPDFHKCKPRLIQNAPDLYRDLLEEASAKETDEVSNCFLSTLNSNGSIPSGGSLISKEDKNKMPSCGKIEKKMKVKQGFVAKGGA